MRDRLELHATIEAGAPVVFSDPAVPPADLHAFELSAALLALSALYAWLHTDHAVPAASVTSAVLSEAADRIGASVPNSGLLPPEAEVLAVEVEQLVALADRAQREIVTLRDEVARLSVRCARYAAVFGPCPEGYFDE